MTRTPIVRLPSTLVADLILQGEGISFDLYRKFVCRIGGQDPRSHIRRTDHKLMAPTSKYKPFSCIMKLGYVVDARLTMGALVFFGTSRLLHIGKQLRNVLLQCKVSLEVRFSLV